MTDGSQPGKRRDAALRTPAARGAEAGAAMKRLRNIRGLQPLRGPPKWVPILGDLQKTLQKGEYLPLRPLPMFESNFVQVTNQGGPVYLHHRPNRVTVGVAASGPGLVLPDILLLAQPRAGKGASCLHLTRMIPLDLAHLYVHDPSTWRLKLRLATGRCYYLELDAPDGEMGFLFERWLCLINLLRQPATAWAPGALHTLLLGLDPSAPPASTWCLQGSSSHTRCSAASAKAPSSYRVAMSRKPRKAQALKRRFKSQAVGDSVPLVWSQLGLRKEQSKEEKPLPGPTCERSQSEILVSEKPRLVIRTIFSIVSSPICQRRSVLKGGTAEVGTLTVQGRLAGTPSFYISGDSPDASSVDSYNYTKEYLGQEDIEDLVDPMSSTLSSSVCPGVPLTAFYHPTTYASTSRPTGNARTPLPQKALHVPLVSWKAPFILDQSQRIPPAPAPSQKIPPAPAPSQKIPPAPTPSQRAPPAPAPSQKIPPVPTPSQRVPPVLASSQRAPPAPAPSQKIPPVPTPSQRVPPVPAPSQRAPPVPALSHRVPPVLAPSQKIASVPALSQRAPPVPTVPQKATSLTVPNEKSLLLPAPSQKALSSDPQPQRVFLPPTTLEKTSAGPGMLLRGDVLQISKEKRELMVGAQQVKTVELRTQAVPLGLPFSTTKEESKEGLTGRSGVKAGAREKEEQISLDLPGGKSKEMGWQKRWVKTHALTLEGPPKESTRPFSVEGLALAKLMIMASSKEQCLRPPAVALPSWLSLSSRESTVSKEASIPFELSQESWLERTPVEVREQPDSNIELKKVTGQWRDVEEAPWDPRKYPQASFHSSPASRSPRMESGPRPPIALPATRWEDVEHLPVASRSPRMDVMARMPQQPLRISKEPSQDLLATMGSSSNTLLPVLVESLRDVSPDGAAAKDKVDIFTVLPRYLGKRPTPTANAIVRKREAPRVQGILTEAAGRIRSRAGAPPSPVETRIIYRFICGGGGWARGTPTSLGLKPESEPQHEPRLCPVCARAGGGVGAGPAGLVQRGRGGGTGVSPDPGPRSGTFSPAQGHPLAGVPGAPANEAGWGCSYWTRAAEARAAADGGGTTPTGRRQPGPASPLDVGWRCPAAVRRPEAPRGKWQTPPFDPRFPNQNQTRNCYQNFLDYHRCVRSMSRRGKEPQPCEYYLRVYRSLCPISWVQRWNEQIKQGTFAGKI